MTWSTRYAHENPTVLTLRGLTVRNRLWIPPMCQYSAFGEDGVPTGWHLVHYGSLAAGGAGALTMEVSVVVTVASSATPVQPLTCAASPPMTAALARPDPGALEAVRADLTRIAGGFGAVTAGLVPGMAVGDTA